VNAVPKNKVEPPPIKQEAKRKLVSIAEKPRSEKIRVELNVEKWPALWRPASSKNNPTLRTLERAFSFDDGGRGSSKLEIGFTHLGTLTTEDQKMFYALIRHWEESGKPADRPVFFSDRLLARLLKKKGWGTNVIEAITASLRRLRTTPLRWIKSYHRNDGTDRQYEEETFFNFLDKLKIVTKREHGHVTNQQGYFQFDCNILANLLANYTKPLLDEEFFKLQTEIGQLLYTHADLILADKTRYERCTRELFLDLGLLDNPSYRYASNRKQALQRPIAELQGMRLSTGVLKSLSIERTKDGKDYKLIFLKGKYETPQPDDLPATLVTEPVVVNHYADSKVPSPRADVEELVKFFHQTFHGIDKADLLTRELDQATALIGKYGSERAKHIVLFARGEAAKTNYQVQHFGAILNYASRGNADFDLTRQQEERTKKILEQQAHRVEEQKDHQARGERRLAALTPEQYEARFESAKAILYRQYPFMARQNEGSKIQKGAIRTIMIHELENEPMDLLPITPPADEPKS
jgi:hypothetical protein